MTPASPATPSLEIGQEFICQKQNYVVLNLISSPSLYAHYWSETWQDGSLISRSDYYAYGEKYWIQNKSSNIVCLCVVFYEYGSSGFPSGEFKGYFDEHFGGTIEPDGYRIYIQEKIGEIQGRKDHHLCGIYVAEKSLDYIGPATLYENAKAKLIKKYIQENTLLTLSSGNQYLVNAFLSAEGAFGTVLKATRINDKKIVALKLQSEFLAKQELSAFQSIGTHTGIVKILDSGSIIECKNSSPENISIFKDYIPVFVNGKEVEKVKFVCLVTELVSGATIGNYLKEKGKAESLASRGRKENDGLSLFASVTLTEQLCNAVSHIHNKGYIHADIKPQNVMVTLPKESIFKPVLNFFHTGKIYIVDMGSVSKKGERLKAFGTGAHAAPEIKEYWLNQNMSEKFSQLRKELETAENKSGNSINVEEVIRQETTCRSMSQQAYQSISESVDIFSVGAVFFTLITGRDPRQLSGEIITDPRKQDPFTLKPVKVTSVLLDKHFFGGKKKYFLPVLEKALNTNPQNRFKSIKELKWNIRKQFSRAIRNQFFKSAWIALAGLMGIRFFSYFEYFTWSDFFSSILRTLIWGIILAIPLGLWWLIERFNLPNFVLRIYQGMALILTVFYYFEFLYVFLYGAKVLEAFFKYLF